MKEYVSTHTSLQTGGRARHAGPCGAGPGMARNQRDKSGELGPEPLRGVLGRNGQEAT